jgi:DNA-binding transcriptional LysR family regulator
MTLHQLRIFESVARHLNITRASKELHMSQPAVSQQLKILQRQFAHKLIVTTRHGVKLTEQGQAFLDAVRPIIEQADRIEITFRIKSNAKETSL